MYCVFRSQIHSTIEQEKLSARFVANLENLAAKEALYRVRISSGQNTFVSASVPACQLLGSSFSDEITVHMTSSKPVGLSYHVSSTKCQKTSPSEKSEFQTQVRVKMADEAPRPNLDPTGTGRPTATASSPTAPTEPEAEPGFFQKYVRSTLHHFLVQLFTLTNHQMIFLVALPPPDPHYAAIGRHLLR